MRLPFGKFRGKDVGDVPGSYLMWLLEEGLFEERHADLRRVIVAELTLRLLPFQREYGYDPYAPPPPAEPSGVPDKVLKTWKRQLVQRYHPDRGGSHEAMSALNNAWDLLEKLRPDAASTDTPPTW